MIIGNWFINIWEFIQKTLFIKIGVFIILIIYLLSNFRSLKEKEGFLAAIHRRLLGLGILFAVYIAILFLFFMTKKYFFYPFDKILFPLLCGILVFFIQLITNQIYIFSNNKNLIFIGIPISFFGSWIAFDQFLLFGLAFIDNPGHSPTELIGGTLFFLLISSLFIGIKNIVKSSGRLK